MPYYRELKDYYTIGHWGVGSITLTDGSKTWYAYNIHEPDDRITAVDLESATRIVDCLYHNAV